MMAIDDTNQMCCLIQVLICPIVAVYGTETLHETDGVFIPFQQYSAVNPAARSGSGRYGCCDC